MRTRKQWEAEIQEGIRLADYDIPNTILAVLGAVPAILLDIRDILEGLDRRMGAREIAQKINMAAFTKVAKKKKK